MKFIEIYNYILFNEYIKYEIIEDEYTNIQYCELFIIAYTNNRDKNLINYLFYKITDYNIIISNKNIFEYIIEKPYNIIYLDHIYNKENGIINNNYENIFMNSVINNYSKYTNIIYKNKKEKLFNIISKENIILLLIFYNENEIINNILEIMQIKKNKELSILKLDKNRYYEIDVSLIPLFIEILYIPNMYTKDLQNIPSSIKKIIFEDFYYIHSIKTLSTIPDYVEDINIHIINSTNNTNNIKIYYDNIRKKGKIYNKNELLNSIEIRKNNIYEYIKEFRNIWTCLHYINF